MARQRIAIHAPIMGNCFLGKMFFALLLLLNACLVGGEGCMRCCVIAAPRGWRSNTIPYSSVTTNFASTLATPNVARGALLFTNTQSTGVSPLPIALRSSATQDLPLAEPTPQGYSTSILTSHLRAPLRP
jgi:hypothetical protein